MDLGTSDESSDEESLAEVPNDRVAFNTSIAPLPIANVGTAALQLGVRNQHHPMGTGELSPLADGQGAEPVGASPKRTESSSGSARRKSERIARRTSK